MFFGMPHSAGLGPSQNAILWQRIFPYADFSGFDYELKPSPGMGDAYYGIYVNGTHTQTVWLAEGEATTVAATIPWGSNSFSYLALRHGHSADGAYEDNDQARFVEEENGNKLVTLEFTFVPEVLGDISDLSGHMSAWTFAGLWQGFNCDFVSDWPSRAKIVADLTVTGSAATLELYAGNSLVASGTATISGPTTLTFTEENSSGLSGTVLLSGSSATVADVDIYVRWPHEMVVYRDTFSPPTTERVRIAFNKENTVRWTEEDELSPDVYYYRLRANSDTDDLGTWTSTLGINLDALPNPPTYLRYVSGDVSNTVLGYSGSSTVSATYRMYAQSNAEDLINLLEPDVTAPTGTLTMALPLDHITGFSGVVDGFSGFSGFSGQVYAMVRAVHPTSGQEEQNMDGILLEYNQFGQYVPKRPNPARLNPISLVVTTGLTATLEATYNGTREDGTATLIKLYARTETGSYDFETPVASSAISTGVDLVRYANLSYVAPAAGFYYVKALAWTASSGRSVAADCNEVLIYVSDVDMSAPSGFSAYASRG